jgi:hypothetical protein
MSFPQSAWLAVFPCFALCQGTALAEIDDAAFDAYPFSIGLAGFAGAQSRAEVAMQRTALRPDAAQVFSAVINDDRRSDVAKLYALCGLKQIGSPLFQSAAGRFASLERRVSVLHGDVLQKERLGDVVARITRWTCSRP